MKMNTVYRHRKSCHSIHAVFTTLTIMLFNHRICHSISEILLYRIVVFKIGLHKISQIFTTYKTYIAVVKGLTGSYSK